MDEREKVIRGLERFIDDFKPFCGNRADWQRVYDALALLKGPEPRVLTREEVMDLLQGSVAWYEEKSESGTYLRALVSAGNGFLGDFYLGINAHEFDFKRGRFWAARPSDEQMRDTPWEGENDADE